MYKWADPIPYVDGAFIEGQGFIVTDVAGQITIYAPGPKDMTSRTPYDQFHKISNTSSDELNEELPKYK